MTVRLRCASGFPLILARMTPSHQKDEHADRRSGANIERHVQTIMISLVTGAVMFAASYFYNDNRGKAVQQSQLEVLTAQVIEMRADLRALQFNYVRRDEIKELELRVRAVEIRAQK